MLIRTLSIGLLLTLLLTALSAQAAPRVAIIVNAENTQELTLQDISNIYNDKVTRWNNGKKIVVYNLPSISAARKTFSYALVGLSPNAADAAEANRRVSNTRYNPQILKGERLIMLSVQTNTNAIAYVRASSIKHKKNIKTLFFID